MCQLFDLSSPLSSYRHLPMVLHASQGSSQKHLVIAGPSILGTAFFLLYTMTFLMLSVISLSMLMIPLSTLSVIRHLICCNNYGWLLNLHLTNKTLQTVARSSLLISILEKLTLFHLNSLIILLLLMPK